MITKWQIYALKCGPYIIFQESLEKWHIYEGIFPIKLTTKKIKNSFFDPLLPPCNAQWTHWALQGAFNITCGVADILSSLADIIISLADILSDWARICLSKGYFAPLWLSLRLSKDEIYTSVSF